jgi:hypothetical protein
LIIEVDALKKKIPEARKRRREAKQHQFLHGITEQMQLQQLKLENPSNSLQYAEAAIFHIAKRKKK